MIIPMIFVFMFGALGVSLFAGAFEEVPREPYPRANFDDIGTSMLVVFTIITGEDWNQVMIQTISATSGIAGLFFMCIVVFGQMIFLNLFIAILLTRMNREGYGG